MGVRCKEEERLGGGGRRAEGELRRKLETNT